MTAGLPGAGIGGLFYMLSALAMPFHAAARLIKARLRPRIQGEPVGVLSFSAGTVLRPFAVAVGIVAALWLTGWTLGLLLTAHPSGLGSMQSPVHARGVPNVLKVATIALSLGTLSMILLLVQIARLVVRRPSRTVAAAAALVMALVALYAAPAMGQTSGAAAPDAAGHLALAERAYDAGESDSAAAEYSAVLAIDPTNTRALFRLGQLWKRDPKRSLPLFRRYVELVPQDAWGHMALADEIASTGDLSRALREYDEALRIAPKERDAVVGRARLLSRAGRTDDAILVLEAWTAAHPDDANALRDLGDQRRRAGRMSEAATAYQLSAAREHEGKTLRRLDAVRATSAVALGIVTNGAGDSDGNRSYRIGANASGEVGSRARLALSAGRKSITGFAGATVDDASLGLIARPTAALRVEATAGALRLSSDTAGLATANDLRLELVPGQSIPGRGRGKGGSAAAPPPGTIIHVEGPLQQTVGVGSIRGVWKQPGGGGLVDLRASRALLDATSVLVVNRVLRNELAGRVDVPLSHRLKLRGGAKEDSYDGISDSNTRTSLLGGVAVAASDAVELSGIFQQIAFDHPTTSGYFAPQRAQLAELGSYAELESDGGTVLALDAGVGAQRFADFGSVMGTWKPAFRLFAQLTVPINQGSEFRAEVDSYDSRLGSEAASSASWRYVSASLSVRFALR